MSVISFKNSQAGVEQFALGDDDDVEARGDLVSTEDLSNQTFSAVSRHRAAELDASYAAYDEHPLHEPDEWGDLASFREAAGAS